MEVLEAGLSLILALLEIEAPSVEVSEEVSGARITRSLSTPSLHTEEVLGRIVRLRCLKLILNFSFNCKAGLADLSELQ